MSDEATAQIICVEVNALPARAALTFPATGGACVYLLDDDHVGGSRVRATILRAAGELVPAGASLLLAIELTQVGKQRVMRVVRTGRTPVDLVRSDGNSRVLAGTEFRSGARFEVPLHHRPNVQFALTLPAATEQGLRASAGGGGTRASAASAAQNSLLWLVPTVIDILNDPLNRLKDGLIEKLGESGLSPRAFAGVLVVLMTLLGTGAFGLSEYWQAQSTQAQLDAMTASQADALAAKQDALASEAACMVDRRALADKVDATELARKLSIEAAFARAAAKSLALEKGGAAFRDTRVAAFDGDAYAADMRSILATLGGLPPAAPTAARCLDHKGALGADLPIYVLTSHPDPNLACPVNYVAVVEGASLRGSWGLSERAATELRAAAQISADDAITATPGFDPRDADRMSAGMLTAGVRAIRSAVLAADLGGRPAMAPSEVNLWSLALFEAANGLPLASPGAAPRTLGQCVVALVTEAAAVETTAATGQPVLPSVASVAAGDEKIPAAPTATCAWPPDSVARGARTALRAVAIGAETLPAPPAAGATVAAAP